MRAEPVVQGWAVDPLPVPAATPLRVEWPSDGLDPFDVADRRTQWLMFASGFTRAWPASEGMQPAGDRREPADVIPMGYTGLSLLEKLAVAHRGRLVAEWPPGGVSPSGKAVYSVQFQRTAGVWLAREPRRLAAVRAGEALEGSRMSALSVGGCADYADTVDLALSAVVVRLVDSWSWH
jgi:hypothetical protein